MKKIHLVGLRKDRDEILKTLMEMGICEISNPDDKVASEDLNEIVFKDHKNAEINEFESEKLKLGKAIELLSKFGNRKNGLFEAKKTLTVKELEKIGQKKKKLWKTVDGILDYNERLVSLKSEKNKKANLISTLKPWISLDIPLDVTSTKETIVLTGVVPDNSNPYNLKEEIEKSFEEVHLDILNSDKEQSYLLLIYHKSVEEEISPILKKYGFLRTTFKDLKGTAKNNIETITKEISEIEKECEKVQTTISSLYENIEELEILYDYLTIQIERKSSVSNMLKTESTFMFYGWVPESTCEKLKSVLLEKWSVYINFIEPDEDEECPILLSNKGIGSTVEGLTEMYSLPDYREIDPNTIMAPFFILFFGLMLSDAGYGLIMSIISLVGIKLLKPDKNMKKFMKLFFFCGLSTMFWGVLFGGLFGIEYISENFALWFNPVNDPQELLKWSLAFGILHVYVGIGVKGVNLFREKKYLDIIFDVLFSYIFFTGFVFFVLPYVPKIDSNSVLSLVEMGKYLMLIGGILLILTQGRKEKKIFAKIIYGLVSIYGVVSFMSDVLSYSRLLALGLATSIIATIINTMLLGVVDISDNIIVKILLIIIIAIGLVFAHLFNFVLNALGAYVHSSRLQYIEFFNKFYKGGGTAFEPLKIETKYINIR